MLENHGNDNRGDNHVLRFAAERRGSSDTRLVLFSKGRHFVQHCPTSGHHAEGHWLMARGSRSRGQTRLGAPGRRCRPAPGHTCGELAPGANSPCWGSTTEKAAASSL